jgi:hypothetical protein
VTTVTGGRVPAGGTPLAGPRLGAFREDPLLATAVGGDVDLLTTEVDRGSARIVAPAARAASQCSSTSSTETKVRDEAQAGSGTGRVPKASVPGSIMTTASFIWTCAVTTAPSGSRIAFAHGGPERVDEELQRDGCVRVVQAGLSFGRGTSHP